MARIRTIKPGFWKHEELSELPAETHMLAASLLNYADDEGYFNANPKLVAAECCPLRDDSVSVHEQLNQLEGIGYIRRTQGADGKTYGHVVTFLEHQRINRPNKSEISGLVDFTDYSVSHHTQVTPGKGREGEKEGNVRTPTESSVLDEAFDEYNRIAEQIGLSQVQARNKARTAKLRQRLAECGGIEGWRVCLEKVAASDFLSGRKTDFRADFDFLMQAKSFTKLMEGGYDNHKPKPPSEPDPSDRRRAILEGLGLSGPGTLDADAGGSEGSDDGPAGGGGEGGARGAEANRQAIPSGVAGSVIQFRGGIQPESQPKGSDADLSPIIPELPGGFGGEGGEWDARKLEGLGQTTDASGDVGISFTGTDAAQADGRQGAFGEAAQETGKDGAENRPEGTGQTDGGGSQAASDLPPMPAFLKRVNA